MNINELTLGQIKEIQSPAAKEASEAFYATLREKGFRVDAVQLALAWERAAQAAIGASANSTKGTSDDKT